MLYRRPTYILYVLLMSLPSVFHAVKCNYVPKCGDCRKENTWSWLRDARDMSNGKYVSISSKNWQRALGKVYEILKYFRHTIEETPTLKNLKFKIV